MVNFCTGPTRTRLVLTLTRFYSPEELFDIVTPHKKTKRVCVEYGPNLFVDVENDHELKFACKMVACDHASYIPEADYQQHMSDQAESTETDLYETYLADAHKARRIARRRNKSGTRSCSLPRTETIPVHLGGVRDMKSSTSTRGTSAHEVSTCEAATHDVSNDASSNSS